MDTVSIIPAPERVTMSGNYMFKKEDVESLLESLDPGKRENDPGSGDYFLRRGKAFIKPSGMDKLRDKDVLDDVNLFDSIVSVKLSESANIDNKDVVFISKHGCYRVTMQAPYREVINGHPVYHPGKTIEFRDHKFETSDPEEVEFLRNHRKRFVNDFYEVGAKSLEVDVPKDSVELETVTLPAGFNSLKEVVAYVERKRKEEKK